MIRISEDITHIGYRIKTILADIELKAFSLLASLRSTGSCLVSSWEKVTMSSPALELICENPNLSSKSYLLGNAWTAVMWLTDVLLCLIHVKGSQCLLL